MSTAISDAISHPVSNAINPVSQAMSQQASSGTYSVDSFPYTAQYIQELLKIDDHVLGTYIEALGLNPDTDPQTGSLVFTQQDLDLLRKTTDMVAHGENLSTIASRNQAGNAVAPAGTQPRLTGYSASANTYRQNAYPGSQMVPAGQYTVGSSYASRSASPPAHSETELAMIVESITHAKEGILKDLARLLDDKLAGLDDVVVELIRCKSENDTLKQKLQATQDEIENLRFELSRYKPYQFGFYRKIGETR